MKKLFAPFIAIAALLVFVFIFSYVFPPMANFLTWWFITKEEINAPISTGQAVLIDVITHIITYGAVGALFGYLDWFNGKAMHIAYVIISEVVALGLALLMRFILNYYWIIFIIIGVLLVVAIVLFILTTRKDKKKTKNKN